ncbi:MAG: hypothetical protein MHPSP_000639 [Paramarteilia canceri]
MSDKAQNGRPKSGKKSVTLGQSVPMRKEEYSESDSESDSGSTDDQNNGKFKENSQKKTRVLTMKYNKNQMKELDKFYEFFNHCFDYVENLTGKELDLLLNRIEKMFRNLKNLRINRLLFIRNEIRTTIDSGLSKIDI